MSQSAIQRWGFVLSFLACIFVAAFTLVGLYAFFDAQPTNFYSHGARLILFVTILVWRVLRNKALFFIPDEMLVTLPWFWLVSVSTNMHNWHSVWIVGVLLLSLLSIVSRPQCYSWFKGGVFGNSLYAAVILGAGFYFSFAFILSRIFSDFTHELLVRTMHGGVWVFAGIFVMNTAFYGLVRRRAGQSVLAVVDPHEAV